MATLKIALRRTVLRVFETELQAWRGLEPLWKAFWCYGVLASSVLIGLYGIAVAQQEIAMQQALLIVFAAYTVWIIVSVWRCAEASEYVWRTLARGLTIAWAGNAALVVTFLQLDLVAAYIGS